ncbi:MAG: sensor histidine kinase [Bacteroidales bacterium]|nr:sensor histidine kinase [Bacteroidales bacterium]
MRAFLFKSNIYRRLVLFFMLVGIVPMVLLSIASYRITQTSIHDKAEHYSTQLMLELSDSIKRVFLSLENTAIDISYSEIIQNYLLDYSGMSIAQRRNSRNDIRMSIALKTSLIREITDVYIYLPDGEREVLYGEDGYKFSLKENYEDEFVHSIFDAGGKTVIRSYSGEHQLDNIRRQQDTEKGIENCLLIGRLVRELDSGDILGVIILRINEQILSKRLNNIDLGRDAQIVVTDSSDRIVSSTNLMTFPISNILKKGLTIAQTHSINTEPGLRYQSDEHMVLQNNIDGLGWSVICLIPYSFLDNETYMNFRNMLILLCCICVIMVFGIGVFSRRISKPLTELVDAMNLVKAGDLNAEVKNESRDEIGQVTRNFNGMLAQIRKLVENVKNKEKEKRKAELAALQAQINPHFLSNTLNTVRCLAHNQKAENIENLLISLIELLHVSMDTREDFIPISKEISYVRSYMEIMSYRDYGNFNIICEVQPELEDSLVPKLILQPLVENSLIHGLKDKKIGGQIIIRVTGDKSNIFISVTDNGQGIPPDVLPTIIQSEKMHEEVAYTGIGLSNVDSRIKMLFGSEYGLYVDSVYQMYTTVEVVLPNLKGEMLNDESVNS